MVHLAILSITASVIYFYVGFYVIRFNRKSDICKLFFLFTLSLAIWSFAGGFVYLAQDTVEYSFWNKISAFGWCTFEAIGLYFVLTLTENRLFRKWYNKLLVILPAGFFLFMVLFLFGPNINTSPMIQSIFYNGNFLYNLIYPLVSIILILRWGIKSKSRIQKKQTIIISTSSFITFSLILILQNILPSMGLLHIPAMGQIFSLVMFFGVFYSIHRYQFMSIPTALITNKLFQELTGLAFLLDFRGDIIKTNQQSYHLLNYSDEDMLGKPITEIIEHPGIVQIMEQIETIQTTVKFDEILIPKKYGESIPFHISVIPLRRTQDILLGLLIIGEDITATIKQRQTEAMLKQNNDDIIKLNNELIEMNRILLQKSSRDSLTNLYNHQHINKVLENIIELNLEENNKVCVMMLDIDYFKQVNDRFGHGVGDKVLVTICDIIEKCIREKDYIGRYGGEEFLVVMPDIGIEDAALIAERIRVSIQSHDFEIKNLAVTISIGVAQHAGETANALINKADKLLYQAKSNGRNRYETKLVEDSFSQER